MNSNNAAQVMPQSIARAALAALVGTGGPFNGTTLHLYANNIVPSPQTPLSAMIEPTFTGYAPVAAIAFGTPFNAPGGGAGVVAPSVDIACSGGTPTDTIYGWYLTDSGDTTLKLIVPLGAPVPIANVGDSVLIQPEIDFSGN